RGLLGELAVVGEVGEEGVELLLRRQLAVERQEADLFVRGVLGEVADVIAAVDENAVLAVDRAQPAASDDDALKSALVGHTGILDDRFPIPVTFQRQALGLPRS